MLVATAMLFLLGHQCFAVTCNSVGLGTQPWGYIQKRPDVHPPSHSSESTCKDRVRRRALTLNRCASSSKLFNFSELQPPLPRSGVLTILYEGTMRMKWNHPLSESLK